MEESTKELKRRRQKRKRWFSVWGVPEAKARERKKCSIFAHSKWLSLAGAQKEDRQARGDTNGRPTETRKTTTLDFSCLTLEQIAVTRSKLISSIWRAKVKHTSIFAFDQRGTSTTMWNTSWNTEKGRGSLGLIRPLTSVERMLL